MPISVDTIYLEMLDRSQLRPRRSTLAGLTLKQVQPAEGLVNRDFYQQVGGAWQWTDRLPWSDDQWRTYAARPALQTWICRVQGATAGYAELEHQPDNNVEIVYFGLLPSFFGQGLGGHFLTETIERAWEFSARRVWVHTCTLDHPAALANYLARGFRQYRVETTMRQISQ